MDTRLSLLDKLITINPNCYIKVGESYISSRKELFTFDLFQKLFEHDKFKLHNNLPIILTLEEEDRQAFDLFYNWLIFETKVRFLSQSVSTQVRLILFLSSIANGKEFRKVIESMELKEKYQFLPYSQFDLLVWFELMNYNVCLDFLEERERLEICYWIFIGKIDRSNDYRFQLAKCQKEKVEEKYPRLAKALKYYNVDFYALQKEYKPFIHKGGGYCN